jgi:hypothetical protein
LNRTSPSDLAASLCRDCDVDRARHQAFQPFSRTPEFFAKVSVLNSLVMHMARIRGASTISSLALAPIVRMWPGGAFRCPVCDFEGMFAPVFHTTGIRRSARCPKCGSLERHRLQRFAFDQVAAHMAGLDAPRILHIAPEQSIARVLRRLAQAGSYVSGDISGVGVDVVVDLRNMPQFAAESWDLVWASHVMEHIDDDATAISEIARVLAPNGVAVLPVPINADQTVEYGAPCVDDFGHVRALGLDYIDRYRRVFQVSVVTSADAPSSIQPWICEDRRSFPTRRLPGRPPQHGLRHLEVVPICVKRSVE